MPAWSRCAQKGVEPWLIARDGEPLPPRRPSEPLRLAPGKRANHVSDARLARLARIDRLDEGERPGVMRLVSVTGNLPPAPLGEGGPQPALPADPRRAPDLRGAHRHEFVLDGGACGPHPGPAARRRSAAASHESLRRLFASGRFWTIDGQGLG